MRQTLKAVFDDRGRAQQALEQLRGAGHANADITLRGGSGAGTGASAGERAILRPPPGHDSASGRLLARIFGHAIVDPADHAGQPGAPLGYTLTLATESDEQAQRAASLVPEFALAPEGQVVPPGSDADADAGSAQMRYRRHVAHEAMHHYARANGPYFGNRDNTDSAMTGTTYREPTLPAGHWSELPSGVPALPGAPAGLPGDDPATRAAYRFGHDMHENDRYRNRSWIEADSDLKVLWDARAPDGPDWIASKRAVHRGWDSTSPEIDNDNEHRRHWRTAYASSASPSRVIAPPGPDNDAIDRKASWKRRHPGELPPWESFMDALRHGWSRIAIGMDVDEADYRRHHADSYPGTNYDDIAPVYRYGNNIRHRGALRGRSWDEVETEVRAEWERGHPEGKPWAWDHMKPALHRGWDFAERRSSQAPGSDTA